MKKLSLIISSLVIGTFASAQVSDNLPCTYPAANEIADGECGTFTTASTTNNLDAVCGNTAVGDAFLWYDGAGAQMEITVTPAAGQDVQVSILTGTDLDPCSGFFYGDCQDAGGAGVAETIVGGGVTGARYLIMIENAAGTGTITGTLCATHLPPTCTDGIQNGTETCADGGGACPAGCPPPDEPATTTCATANVMTSNEADCSMVGTANYTAVTGGFDGSTTTSTLSNVPSPNPGTHANCPTPTTSSGNDAYGMWVRWNPDDVIDNGTISLSNGDADGSNIYIAWYQEDGSGSNCASDYAMLGCDQIVESITSMGVTSNYVQPANVPTVDGSKDLYGFVYATGMGGYMNFSDLKFIGSDGAPTNTTSTFDDCATPLDVPTTTTGCNLGAVGGSFTPPSQTIGYHGPNNTLGDGSWGSSTICNGGTWYTNENTVFFSFTPTSTEDTLSIENVTCDAGQTGIAQFGVWGSCAAVFNDPTSGPVGHESDFYGCAVGTADLNLSGLDPSQTYIIAVDGNAGAVCIWDFVGTIVTTKLTLIDFDAKLNNQSKVDLYWNLSKSKREGVIGFELERGDVKFNYKSLMKSNNVDFYKDYRFVDNEPFKGKNNYRIKLIHADGSVTYSEVKQIKVDASFSDISVVPNPVFDNATISFTSSIVGSSELMIMDGRGAEVKKQTVYVVKGENAITLDTKDLQPGIYLAALKGVHGTEVKRFYKK